jgi:prolyl oligopeptidase
VESPDSLAWVKAENAKTLPLLSGDPRFAGLQAQALTILSAKDRIAAPNFIGQSVFNFWQDATHVRGIWRRTTLASYKTAAPVWETVLDIDALAKAEGRNWVYKGASCLAPEDRYCLVSLSDGGKDAVVYREFDTVTKTFLTDGFVMPEGKQNVTWVDRDTLLVARDWGEGTMTKSSYPFVVKRWTRGEPLSAATELFRGTVDDVAVSPFVLRDADGAVQAVMLSRATSFFESEYYLITDKGPVKLPFPLKSSIQGLVQGRLVFSLEQDWDAHGLKQGDLAAFDLAALKADPVKAHPALILRPTARQSIEGVTITRNRLIIALFEDVKGKALVYTPAAGGWTSKALDLPGNATLACDFKTFKKRLLQGTHENTMLECRNTTTTIDEDVVARGITIIIVVVSDVDGAIQPDADASAVWSVVN